VPLPEVGGAARVPARVRGQPPAPHVQVDGQVHQQPGGAAEQVGAGAAGRQLGQVRQLRQLAEHGAHRLADVGTRQRTDPGRRTLRQQAHTAAIRDSAIVAEPSTMSPPGSGWYATMACPGATPRTGRCSRATSRPPSTATVAGTTSPCARNCTSAGTGLGPVHNGRSPYTVDTSRASAGPTVTVLVTGVMDSTYRGRPSAAGRSRRSPRRCPTVYA